MENRRSGEIIMTYEEYRYSFKSVEEFKKAFAKLSEDKAYAFISTIKGSTTVKACAMSSWREAKKELEEQEKRSS